VPQVSEYCCSSLWGRAEPGWSLGWELKLELQKPECNKASDTEAGCLVPNIASRGKKNKMAQINIHVTQLMPFLKRFLLLLFFLLLHLLLSSVFYLVFIISPPCLFYFWIGHNFVFPLSISRSDLI